MRTFFLILITFSLCLIPSLLLAQAPASMPPVPSFSQALAKMLPMFLMVFFIFYIMVLRPQQKKLLEQQNLISGLKSGDSVVTSSGIIARVASLEKDYIVLEIANNVKVKIEPSHLSKKLADTKAKAA